MANNIKRNVRYVYHLPYFERRELCRILDRMDKWEELGGIYMKFDTMTIQDLRREILRGNSPSDELLTLWGHQNHTVLELFVLLSEMQHYQAMLVLKPFVDPYYHRFIYEGEEMLRPLSNGSRSLGADSKVPSAEAKEAATAGKESGAAVNGEASRAGGPSGDKKLDIGHHNLNLTESTEYTHSKLTFPAEQQQPERKILNTMRLSPAFVPESDNEAARFPRPLTVVTPPTSQERVCQFPPDNKENNAPGYSQHRKMSNVSDVSSVTENCGSIPQINYQELVEATQSWSVQNILGKGGFGTVYKGIWKNTQVAVKRIEQRGAASAENNQAQLEQSLRELRILNSCRHDNILPLFGFSVGGVEPCLVYQFMPNGSLEDRLLCRKGSPPLTWLQRHNIAQGTARGLQFLHNSRPFIHGDIKSANILLDINFIPRIGDFGLAREGPQNNYTHMKVSRVHGTRPYLPDEFLRGKQISTKVDTYSFGIVLFELATGLRAYDDSRSYKLLKEHVENCTKEQLETLVDKKAVPENPAIFQHLVALGLECVKKIPKQRPKMEKVLEELEAVASRHQIHDLVQYPGSSGAMSTGGQCIRTNPTLTIPSHHPAGSIQQAGLNNLYFCLPPNISSSHNFLPVAAFPSPSCSPSHSPQPISALGMHSPHALGLASHPFPVTPQYVPSPEVEVSPGSQESLGNNHLPAAVLKQGSESQGPSRHAIPDQELAPSSLDDLNKAEPSLQNGMSVSALLPNLSILGVDEGNHSSHAGTPPSASCLDFSDTPETSACESTSLNHSSAQGKSLIFDLRSVEPKDHLDKSSASNSGSVHDL